jgi:hypothetical protein
MKLNGTTVFVAGNDGYSEMNLTMLVAAVQGGMELSEVAVFTEPGEARDEVRRRQLVEKGVAVIQRLSVSELETVVPKLEQEAIDRSVEKVMEKVLG